jgi:hypothetical protein
VKLPGGFTITIASPPDRERLVAEVFHEDEQLAEVHTENGEPTVIFHPRRDGKPWELPLGVTLAAIEMARKRLIEGD